MYPSCSGFGGPGLSRIIVSFCQGTFSGNKVLTSGSSRELMKEQVLAAFSSCAYHVVGVTQEDASRIERCQRTPIRSCVSSELGN